MNGVVGIYIYSIPDDPHNERARHALQRLSGVGISEVVCPPSVRDLYRVPFVRDENGGRYFGVEEIERFVDKRLEREHVA